MGLLAGFWSFRTGFPPEIQFVAALGIGVIVVLAAFLFAVRNFGRAILGKLPLPERALEFYDRFEEGLFAINRRTICPLAILTVLIWATEGTAAVARDPGAGPAGRVDGHLGGVLRRLHRVAADRRAAQPGRARDVELGVVGVLTLAYGLPTQEATPSSWSTA